MAPRTRRTAATESPAAEIWAMVSGGEAEMATAAMDFMGWTGMGRPKSNPVTML